MKSKLLKRNNYFPFLSLSLFHSLSLPPLSLSLLNNLYHSISLFPYLFLISLCSLKVNLLTALLLFVNIVLALFISPLIKIIFFLPTNSNSLTVYVCLSLCMVGLVAFLRIFTLAFFLPLQEALTMQDNLLPLPNLTYQMLL